MICFHLKYPIIMTNINIDISISIICRENKQVKMNEIKEK